MGIVLFAFLGTGRYLSATYAFGPAAGDRSTTRFAAQAMLDVSARNAGLQRPDRIVLCGTKTSGWMALAEALRNPGGAPGENLAAGEPDAAILNDLAVQYSALLGVPVTNQLIGFGMTPGEQAAFVAMVAEHVQPGDTVHFDVTHGLRHLPMLAFIAALAVRTLRRAVIGGIWYGAYELRNEPDSLAITGAPGMSPMLKLDGLLSMAGWLAALNVFDATGNVGAFAQPLREEGKSAVAKELDDAAFDERVAATLTATQSAAIALEALENVHSGVAAVVRPAIESRLAWAGSSAEDTAGFAHAVRFVEAGNEARAATLIYETSLALLARRAGLSVNERNLPEAVSLACKIMERDNASRAYAAAYLDMKNLRNALVHLRPRDAKTKASLSSPARLRSILKISIQTLGKEPPSALVSEIRRRFTQMSGGQPSGHRT